MTTQTVFSLNLHLLSGGEPVIFEFRAAWASGNAIAIKNPAGSQYVNSAHVAMFSVS